MQKKISLNLTRKGFTIIELLVVVAIIAVLTGIVLVNVTAYINKGKNAAIQGNMSTLSTNSATFFDTNSGAFGSDFIGASTGCVAGSAIVTAVSSAGGSLVCAGDPASQAWCGASPTLPAGFTPASTFCVDSTGYKGIQGSGGCTGTTYTCQ